VISDVIKDARGGTAMEKKKPILPKVEFHSTKKAGVLYLVARDGEKRFYIRYRTPDGRQRFEKAVVPGVRMTAAKAADLRRDRARGLSPTNRERREAEKAAKRAAASRWDFSRLFDAYMEAKGEYPRRRTDSGNWAAHLVGVVGKKTPAELTSFDIDRIKRDMKKPRRVVVKSRKEGGKDRVVEKGRCKPGTVVAALGLLVRLALFGEKRALCEGTRCTVELPKIGTVKTEQMNDEQMRSYLKAAAECENKVVGAFLTFLLLTGMRLGEARNLIWDAVDIQKGAVHIRSPKGGKDQFIPLSDAARDLLERLPRDPDAKFVFSGVRDEKGKRSGRIGISTAVRYGKKFAKAAGLPDDFRPVHSLRHCYASALASSGEVDMYVLQKLLTHKSPQMTQRYAHLRDETLRRGAEVMSRIVEEAKTEHA
jgi:integrase